MDKKTRKDFISTGAAAAGAAGICLCGLNGCATFTKVGDTPPINPEACEIAGGVLKIDLEKEPRLKQAGGSVKVIDPRLEKALIIACVAEGTYAAASLHCTHRQVEVEYDNRKKNFECASLGSSTYSLDGKNTGGPAEKPLNLYEIKVKDSVLAVKL